MPLDEVARYDWYKDDQPTIYTGTSSIALTEGYAACDALLEVGVIIINCKTGRVLLFRQDDGTYQLPTCAVENGLVEALDNPLQFVHDETGYIVERLPLPKMSRRFINSECESWDELDVAAVTLDETTTDMFHTTADVVWLEEPEISRYQQPRQAMQLWFGGNIAQDKVSRTAPKSLPERQRTGQLLTFDEAMKRLRNNPRVCNTHVRALEIFFLLWNNRDKTGCNLGEIARRQY